MDMMFNTDVIVKDMKGGKEDMTKKRFVDYFDKDHNYIIQDLQNEDEYQVGFVNCDEDVFLKLVNKIADENEQLKNKIYVLEDDNETYYKSLEQLNLYTKRFIPTKCTNEFKDCKTNCYYWLDHEGNFNGCLELLNLLDCERELLESENRQLKGKLLLYEEQIKCDFE